MTTTQPLSEASYCRLTRALIERYGVNYAQACATLASFRLDLVCSEAIRFSPALQAAVITAINSGKRAFHGGVTVEMPENVPALIPWSDARNFNEIVREVVGDRMVVRERSGIHETLYFGNAEPRDDGLFVLASGWRGGIAPKFVDLPRTVPDFALAGVAAGAHAVARAFLRISGLSSRDVVEPIGVSLWNPSADWMTGTNEPAIEFLPQALWLLGLGHLGQAFVWNLGLLNYGDKRPTLYLQDFDRACSGNWSAGLLTHEGNFGDYKTRIASRWLEERGFDTRIIERPFDEWTKRQGGEPKLALAGFDSPEPRRLLDKAGFELVIDVGLGHSADFFDSINLFTLPGDALDTATLWGSDDGKPAVAGKSPLIAAFELPDDCGILASTLAEKSVSTAFVGAYAGALAVSEIVRAYHGGRRSDCLSAQLRSNDPARVVQSNEDFQLRVAPCGYYAAGSPRQTGTL